MAGEPADGGAVTGGAGALFLAVFLACAVEGALTVVLGRYRSRYAPAA